jgi:hypothetical protein
LKEENMTIFRYVCVLLLKYKWNFPSGPSEKSSENPFSHWGKGKRVSYSRVPLIVTGRTEHPFMSICDLHDQLIVNVEKVKIVIFGTYFLTAYKSRFAFLGIQ